MLTGRPAERLLVTGGAGFIGSEFVRRIVAGRPEVRVTVLDKLTYAGNRANLAHIEEDPTLAPRLRFVRGDIADADLVRSLVGDSDAVVNFAAESHVDRSIHDASAFLRTGVLGVHALLEAVREATLRATAEGRRPVRYVQVSTDEVYGSIEDGSATETSPLRPTSPYAVAKAAGDLLVQSYHATYALDTVITRGSNTFGPYQHPEKLIPLFLTNALEDRELPLYGDGLQRRDWIHVSDHAAGIEAAMRRGPAGSIVNLPGGHELANRDVVARLLEALGKPWTLVRAVADREGHDRRYAIDGAAARRLGWQPAVSFADGIASTIDWYRTHEAWWRAARSNSWDDYYARQYGTRLAESTEAAR